MSLINVPSIGQQVQKVNPIPSRPKVGVKEDGFAKQFANRERRTPVEKTTTSPEAGNPNGQSFGTRVQ
uniref:Tail assembly chaperone n=1 Tax=Micrococcus phage Kurnik TaxID=3092208 RepID=A0AAU6R636_9CAUD